MIKKKLPLVSRLKELLDYDKETGIFTFTKNGFFKKNAGKKSGSLHPSGYVRISIDRVQYMAHRLAWLYVTGSEPKDEIDHINNDKSDNRFCNLREATRQQNNFNTKLHKNNSSGVKGVCFHKSIGKWQASCRLNKMQIHIGYFDDKIKASLAYENFVKQNHGNFYNKNEIVRVENHFVEEPPRLGFDNDL